MVGTNIERERMPDGVEVRPIADLALIEADPSITKAAGGGQLDAVVLIGHHASTPSPHGFCSHTFIWEMEVAARRRLAQRDPGLRPGRWPPRGSRSWSPRGDRWMLEEIGEGELGSARLVATKEGEGRARPARIDPAEARAELAEAIADALAAPPAAAARRAATRPSCGSPSTARRSRARPSPTRPTC